MLSILKREILFISAVIVLTLLLAGCGGGGGGGGAAPDLPQPEPQPESPISPFIQSLPQTYRQASHTTASSSLTAPSYINERPYGIELIGADSLHWSRPVPIGGGDVGQVAETEADDLPFIRGAGVTVGIIDSGVDTDHPDLRDNVLTITSAEVELEHIEDNRGHGTRVAGIIAARLNGSGVVGVAPEAKLLAVRALFAPGTGLDVAYNHLSANHVFVVNNSWGRNAEWVLVGVGANVLQDTDRSPISAGKYWLQVPGQFRTVGSDSGLQLERPDAIELASFYNTLRRAATEQDLLLVFSNGNAGWNSETGIAGYCPEAEGDRCGRLLSVPDSNVASLTIYGYGRLSSQNAYAVADPVTLGRNTVIAVGKNVIGAVKRMPIDYPTVAQNWINVAAVDRNSVIAVSSNGCGVAKARCLVAPGVDITTTKWGGGMESESATSYSAPHVSGAAALLKGVFPSLSPAQVAQILLESADGLGECAGEKNKAIPCSDEVYGHGMLNVSAAFTPSSFIKLAAARGSGDSGSHSASAAGSGFSIRNSRIQLSPVFGAAPWQTESLDIGGLDNYGRVFYTRVDFSDGVYVTKPMVGEGREVKGAGIHSAYAAPLSQPVAAAAYIAADELASAQWRQSGQGLSYGLSQAPRRQSHFISLQPGNSRLAWHTRSGGGELATFSPGYWQAPFDQGVVHQLRWDYPPASAGASQVGVMLGGGDGVRQTAAQLQWRWADWALTAEGGVVREAERTLGASFTGGFSVKETDTVYRRLHGAYQPARGPRLFADYVQSDSAADGAGGIVRRLTARANAWAAGLAYQHWRFIVSQPLVVTSGGLDLSYISGYTVAGDYAVTRKRLDLSSARRTRRVSLLYEREPIDGLGFVLGLDVWRHAPSRGHAGDLVMVSGALRYRF